MIDVKTLDELGVPVPYEDANRSWETYYYERLDETVRNSADGIEIDDIRQRPYGILLIVNDDLRREHPVIGDAYGVLWHTDNDMHDADCGMNLVDKATATRLVNNSVSALIADVIEHYKKCPLDDGNPAYRLFQNWLADQRREEAPATT